MSASFVLELDTQAPVVTFGTPVVRDQESLTVSYSINEPSVESAVVTLPDSTELVGVVQADKVVFDLSALSWSRGTVKLTTLDEVGNRADWSLIVSVPTGPKIIEIDVNYPDLGMPRGMTIPDWSPDFQRYAGIVRRR